MSGKEVAPGVRRVGNGAVNAYLVEDGGAVTIVDAGVSGYWKQLPEELAAMGRSLEDVRAVILTHGHSDHIGFAERIRRERSTPVRIHAADATLARGEIKPPGQGGVRIRLGPLVRFLVFGLRYGGIRTTPIKEILTFDDGATLDVPGAPRVVHLPGHTPGSVAFELGLRGVAFVGDAIATRNVVTDETGPRIAPFTADEVAARASLDRLAALDARTLFPGHGEPWAGDPAEAVRLARAAPSPAKAPQVTKGP